MITLILFILVLFVLIIIHEAGHFIAAKLCKMRVEEFAFGFKPTLFSKKIGETQYSFNLLPIGGYVRIAGENFEDSDSSGDLSHKDLDSDVNNRSKDKKSDPRSFTSRPRWQQLIVVLAGVFMNLLLAFVIFFFIAKSEHWEVVNDKNINNLTGKQHMIINVIPGSPASKNNIKEGDVVLYIKNHKGVKVDQGEQFIDFMKNNTDMVHIGIIDDKGNQREVIMSAVYGILEDKKQKAFGISLANVGKVSYNFTDSLVYAYDKTIHITLATVSGFYHLIHKIVSGENVSNMVTGPVGIYQMIDSKNISGSEWLLSFVAIISINLAIFNLLPIPALDGGRAVFIIIEMAIRKKLNHKFQIISNSIGFSFLLLLMIFVMYKDIMKFLF